MANAEPSYLEDWGDRAKDVLDMADAFLWERIKFGKWASPAQARDAIAAHRHIEQAKERLEAALEIERLGIAPPPPMHGSQASSSPSVSVRAHAHAWKERGDGGAVCEVPGCGILVARGERRPKESDEPTTVR